MYGYVAEIRRRQKDRKVRELVRVHNAKNRGAKHGHKRRGVDNTFCPLLFPCVRVLHASLRYEGAVRSLTRRMDARFNIDYYTLVLVIRCYNTYLSSRNGNPVIELSIKFTFKKIRKLIQTPN